jgi:hypothetical protein
VGSALLSLYPTRGLAHIPHSHPHCTPRALDYAASIKYGLIGNVHATNCFLIRIGRLQPTAQPSCRDAEDKRLSVDKRTCTCDLGAERLGADGRCEGKASAPVLLSGSNIRNNSSDVDGSFVGGKVLSDASASSPH